jgi:hypothetical protein
MPGKKTSVWLGEDELEGWQELGTSLTVIVKAGIAALREQAAASQPDLTTVAADVQAIRQRVDALPDDDRLKRIVTDAITSARGESYA